MLRIIEIITRHENHVICGIHSPPEKFIQDSLIRDAIDTTGAIWDTVYEIQSKHNGDAYGYEGMEPRFLVFTYGDAHCLIELDPSGEWIVLYDNTSKDWFVDYHKQDKVRMMVDGRYKWVNKQGE